jgi:hypothetical protein
LRDRLARLPDRADGGGTATLVEASSVLRMAYSLGLTQDDPKERSYIAIIDVRLQLSLRQAESIGVREPEWNTTFLVQYLKYLSVTSTQLRRITRAN